MTHIRTLPGSQSFFTPAGTLKAIIAINIVMFIVSLIYSGKNIIVTLNPFYALTPSLDVLTFLGASGRFPIIKFNSWWSLITANWLHGGLLHILFNMMAFWQICPLVIREFGLYRTFVIYTASGIIGFFVSYLAGVTFTIGASAAIFGLMGSLIYYGKSRGGLYGQAIYKQVGGWVIGMFLLGLMIPVINNWGHGGGLLGGILLAYWVGYQEKSREKSLHRSLAFACVLTTLLTLTWAVFSGIYIRVFA